MKDENLEEVKFLYLWVLFDLVNTLDGGVEMDAFFDGSWCYIICREQLL